MEEAEIRHRLTRVWARLRFRWHTASAHPEVALQLQLLEIAREGDWRVGALRWHVGTPDLQLERGGERLAVELKADGKSPHRHQQAILRCLQEEGWEIAAWRPRDLPAIRRRLLGEEIRGVPLNAATPDDPLPDPLA